MTWRRLFPLSVLFLWVGASGCDPSPTLGPTKAPPPPRPSPTESQQRLASAQAGAATVLNLAGLQQAIQMFQAQEDRFPTNLAELTVAGYLREIPQLPAGEKLDYDPATGQVGWSPK